MELSNELLAQVELAYDGTLTPAGRALHIFLRDALEEVGLPSDYATRSYAGMVIQAGMAPGDYFTQFPAAGQALLRWTVKKGHAWIQQRAADKAAGGGGSLAEDGLDRKTKGRVLIESTR